MTDTPNLLQETLAAGELSALAVEYGEAISDALLDDGLAKDIPLLGTVYGLCKAGVTIRDHLFLKKLAAFLSEVADVPEEGRAALISSIDCDAKYQVKVGEKLIYLLDKADDHESSQIVGMLFAAFLRKQLTYEEFLRASRATQAVMSADFWRFVEDERRRWDAWAAGDLVASGLVSFDESEIRVEDETDQRIGKYRVENGEVTVSITDVGNKIRAVLRPRRKETTIEDRHAPFSGCDAG